MSFEGHRSALFTYVQAQWAAAGISAPIEFENIDVIDHAQRKDEFVTIELRYRDGHQATLEGPSPQTRFDGEVCFHIHIPEGRGTKTRTTLADAIAGFMKYKQLSGLQIQAPRLLPKVPYKGFEITPLHFSFYVQE